MRKSEEGGACEDKGVTLTRKIVFRTKPEGMRGWGPLAGVKRASAFARMWDRAHKRPVMTSMLYV